jgi:tetratricopeptide (TPR) repeat protein
MKNYIILSFVLLCLFQLPGCKNGASKKEQQQADLISTRTLGLAYLEEFKLEEAEIEFLKLIKMAPKEKLGYANLGLTYLRMAEYDKAEKQLFKAIKIDPEDPDIRLILSTVYQMKDEQEKAIEQLKEALQYSPGHVKTLYNLTEIYSTLTDDESKKLREEYMLQLVENAPANLVPRLNLTDIFIRQGSYDKALEQLEIIHKQFPEFHEDAEEYFRKTVAILQSDDKTDALSTFIIFHNFLKVTTPYQAGMNDLKGPGGALIGFPLITFEQQAFRKETEYKSLLEAIDYTDVTDLAGLDIIGTFDPAGNPGLKHSAVLASADYDGDGDIDLYVSTYDIKTASYTHFLFNNETNLFNNVVEDSGIDHTGRDISATFADYDNDGFLDLCIAGENEIIIYHNTGEGTFTNATGGTKIDDSKAANNLLFADYDHDGDLDLFVANDGLNQLFRNNADGTFEEQGSRMGLSGDNVNSVDAAFGDFDEDGDIDLFVVNDNAGNYLYSNQREGIFKDITAQSRITDNSGSGAVAAGDYDNDGYYDLFVGSSEGTNHTLYHNNHEGAFDKVNNTGEISELLQDVIVHDACFLDFDNDGCLDLCIAGEPVNNEKRGLLLFHNDGNNTFTDASDLLPENIKTGRQLAIIDYNDDGDLDIIVAGLNGGISLLRNNGGNIGHFIKMKLVGLRAGSAKNNYFGIGAKVELRSGELYQTKIVTDPDIHFGIGNRTRADVIRITWTNGIPQNMFYPESDQALVEAQMLKGSCPFLYTWNGEEYIFAKDILWRSALGMPMGIMGGTTTYAFADASDDYIKIPGEFLKPVNGEYSMQMTCELWETIYIDELELVVVDHPDSVGIYVDEKFSPPPFPGMQIYKTTNEHLPLSATDTRGNDVLQYISELDDTYITSFMPGKYQGITEMQDLVLDLGEFDESENIYLFLQGWIFPTDASINFALSQSQSLKVISPYVQVADKNGKWVTVIENIGFPMGKDKTVVADLTGKFMSPDHRVRIRTNMEIYWDRIFYSAGDPDVPVTLNVLHATSADLHYRGFSREYRKGGRYGPHWFDYSEVNTDQKFRDLTGYYTRFGDVLPLIESSDNKYVITNAGDEVTVKFSEEELPDLKEGWKRDFLIHSVGWVKDGDMNTALGNIVTPLPFHGIKSYPPSKTDKYPDDPEFQEYNKEYNTRYVSTDDFVNAIKDYGEK